MTTCATGATGESPVAQKKKMNPCATGATGESPVATGEKRYHFVQQVKQVNHLLHRRKKEMTTCATGATGESPVAQKKKDDTLCNRYNR